MQLTASEIEKATGGKVVYKSNSAEFIENITTDSRKPATASTLFIPLKGDNFDGKDYIEDFFANGGGAYLDAPDGRKALQELARFYRSKFAIPVIGITGSVGKTSTKEMVAAALTGKYKIVKTQGNFNNDIGLPLTIFNIDSSTEIAILEMGMNHFGEMSNLSSIAKPTIAVITNIGTAHIGNLGNQQGILQAKLEILDFLAPNGAVILNNEDKYLKDLQLPYKTIKVNKSNDFNLKISGDHNLMNASVAFAVAKELGVPEEIAKLGIESLTPKEVGRQNEIEWRGVKIIDDAYNASLSSMQAALSNLGNFNGRKIAVLGDMLELGEYEEQHHDEVLEFAKEKADIIITFGKNFRGGDIKCKSLDEVARQINEISQKGDIILIKGSHGSGLYKLTETLCKA